MFVLASAGFHGAGDRCDRGRERGRGCDRDRDDRATARSDLTTLQDDPAQTNQRLGKIAKLSICAARDVGEVKHLQVVLFLQGVLAKSRQGCSESMSMLVIWSRRNWSSGNGSWPDIGACAARGNSQKVAPEAGMERGKGSKGDLRARPMLGLLGRVGRLSPAAGLVRGHRSPFFERHRSRLWPGSLEASTRAKRLGVCVGKGFSDLVLACSPFLFRSCLLVIALSGLGSRPMTQCFLRFYRVVEGTGRALRL